MNSDAKTFLPNLPVEITLMQGRRGIRRELMLKANNSPQTFGGKLDT